MQRWLAEPAENHVERIEILLKLFFGRQVSVADNITHVKQFREFQQQLLQKFRTCEQELKVTHCDDPNYPYWFATLNYGLHISQALLNWCDETLDMLSKMAEETPNI